MTARRFYIGAPGLVNALGNDTAHIAAGLFAGDTGGMVLRDGWLTTGPARVGIVQGALPAIPCAHAAYACRSSQLLLCALEQITQQLDAALTRFGPSRIGVVLGTSTSGIAEGEVAIAARESHGALPAAYNYTQQEIGMPAPFLARYLGLGGPAYTVSTACTSSAKAFASARRLLRHGLCDAVLVGGVDSLSGLTVNGFAALESLSAAVCNPMSRNRRGINIGEGAALFLMGCEEDAAELLGIGESSDAHHISAPHPQGRGAEAAMRAALADGHMEPDEVGYINLHATATPKNDEMESQTVQRIFGSAVPCSGTKPMTGHMLGTAGATELAFCWLALQQGRLPPHVWDGEADPALPVLDFVGSGRSFSQSARRIALSNSFAFGGSNACLALGEPG